LLGRGIIGFWGFGGFFGGFYVFLCNFGVIWVFLTYLQGILPDFGVFLGFLGVWGWYNTIFSVFWY